MTDPTTPDTPAASALSEENLFNARQAVWEAFWRLDNGEELEPQHVQALGKSYTLLTAAIDAAREQGRTSPAGEGVEEAVERLNTHTLPHLEKRRSGSAAARLDEKAIRTVLAALRLSAPPASEDGKGKK